MKKKIAIIHPKIGWGGSEATLFWMLQALRDDYCLTLITTGVVDLAKINNFYRTSLNENDFSVITVPLPFFLSKTAKFAALRGRFIEKYCQQIFSQFDLMIHSYNPCDFKFGSGIQFATDIAELQEIMALPAHKRLWYGRTFFRNLYMGLCNIVLPINIEGWKKNLTVSNSNWTAGLLYKKYGIKSLVLYPPVGTEFSNIDYAKKKNGFICIGRITPEKTFETAIDILEEVRKRGHDIHLHIIGKMDRSRYANFLTKKILKNKDWVFVEDRVGEEKKRELLLTHLFGISCRKNEPFGIAIAEMVKSGCIVFVPDGGGQTEIVNDSRLTYKNKDEAVEKICKVIENDAMQLEFRKKLLEKSQKFSLNSFSSQIKNIVKNFYEEQCV